MKLPNKPRKIRLLLIPLALALSLIGWTLIWGAFKKPQKKRERDVERLIVVDVQERKSL